MTPLAFGSHVVAAGTYRQIRIPVTVGLNGSDVVLWCHVIRGNEPGPVLVVLSTLHGSEWFSIPPLRTLVAATQPSSLRGTLVVVPVANPPALLLQTRTPMDESDSPDLNRILPGRLTRISDQLAAALCEQVLPVATHLIDLHSSPWGSSVVEGLVGAKHTTAGLADESLSLALAFGCPVVRRVDVLDGIPGSGSSIGYAGNVLQIPSLIVELGGPGFGPALEDRWHTDAIDGIRAVMSKLKMISATRDPRPARQFVCSRTHHVNPSRGGLLRPLLGPEALGTELSRGTPLGDVLSPYTHDHIERLVAPVRGVLSYVARSYLVRPGDWAFGVADAEDPQAEWVENPMAGSNTSN